MAEECGQSVCSRDEQEAEQDERDDCHVGKTNTGAKSIRGNRRDPLKVTGRSADSSPMGIVGIALSIILAVAAVDALYGAARGVVVSLRA